MKSVGITGPAGSGKSTLFKALGGTSSSDVVAVAVPDPRLDVLAELHKSKERVPARVQVVDVHATARTQPSATARLREMDALLAVVPGFPGQDPASALKGLEEDLVIADMGPVETRLVRARKDKEAKHEVPSLEAATEHLESGQPLRSRSWSEPDLKVFSSLAPLTIKPLIVVVNVDEEGLESPPEMGSEVFFVNAALEAEVAGVGADDAAELLAAYGIKEPVLGRVVSGLYRSLDLITFFTAGDKESRAWEVRRGATAPEAAGAIHSDIQRGFIRAEVIDYDTLVELGEWDAAKAKGLLRVEGKDYVFKEGDVTHFRFSV